MLFRSIRCGHHIYLLIIVIKKAYVGAARMSHDGGYGNKVLRRRDEFVSVSVAARNNATSQAMASQADGGRKSVDL